MELIERAETTVFAIGDLLTLILYWASGGGVMQLCTLKLRGVNRLFRDTLPHDITRLATGFSPSSDLLQYLPRLTHFAMGDRPIAVERLRALTALRHLSLWNPDQRNASTYSHQVFEAVSNIEELSITGLIRLQSDHTPRLTRLQRLLLRENALVPASVLHSLSHLTRLTLIGECMIPERKLSELTTLRVLVLDRTQYAKRPFDWFRIQALPPSLTSLHCAKMPAIPSFWLQFSFVTQLTELRLRDTPCDIGELATLVNLKRLVLKGVNEKRRAEAFTLLTQISVLCIDGRVYPRKRRHHK